jgi:glycosyltransferase involved in cell wall biosynthesis
LVISGKTIICFASGWDYHPTSKHHIMRRLAERNRVIWVNWHASRRPRVHAADIRAIGSKIRQICSGPRRASDAITVLTPWQVPMPAWRLARRINAWSVRRAVRQVLATLTERPVQVWSFAPDVADVLGTFNEELVVYYCVDAFGEFPGYNRALIEARERELLQASDVVITTSPPLYEAKRELHDEVHFVQHGVDYARLSEAVTEDLPLPADLRDLPRPIIGYVGVIGEWVDVDLLAEAARRRPDASFVVIGPVQTPDRALTRLPNLHWLGERDHATLPAYLRAFDVGLIPFRHVPLTHNANPIKLYEYLAAGVPVVSTCLPAVLPIRGSVWTADDTDSFDTCCGEALGHNSPAARQARSQLMESESWQARLEQIERIILERLDARTSPARRTAENSKPSETRTQHKPVRESAATGVR